MSHPSTASSLLDHWQHEGYILVPHLVDAPTIATVTPICEGILASYLRHDPQRAAPGNPNGHVMRHLSQPAYLESCPEWRAPLLELIAHPAILDLVSTILGERPLFRCSSFWFNPCTEEQDGNWHRDTQFTTATDTEEQNRMQEIQRSCQLQLALVPTEDNEYVPGSHRRWDTPEEYRIRKADGGTHNRSNAMPGAVRLRQEPGDALVFNPVGLHRGRYHCDKYRRTLMLTYTAESTPVRDFFSNQPWFLAAGVLDDLSPGARAFYQRFVDTYADYWLAEVSKG